MLQTNQILQKRYRVDAPLGQGGMGAVYRALDLRLQKVVVVKELLIQSGMPQTQQEATAQFWKEARTLANLSHPNLPRVTDYFEEQGSYFLVMDFVEGQSLSTLIGNGLSETIALSYADQLLDVLEYIHSQGVLHRDIKPANIIVQPDGRVVLVDFGLVKSMLGSQQTTMPFIRGAGTPLYAPPEQYTGGTDQRSDIYALGGTLYHALTGQAPTTATGRIVGTALPEPRRIKAGITATTERAILKALALNPDARHQTAAEFRAALHGRAVTGKEPLQDNRHVSTNNILIVAVVLGAVLLLAVAVIVVISIAPKPATDKADTSTSATPTLPIIGTTPSPSAVVAMVSDTPPPSDTPQATVTPSQTPSATPAPVVMDAANASRVDRLASWKLGAVNQITWSPAGDVLAGSGLLGNLVRLWRATDGSTVMDLSGHTGGVRGGVFSPDGNTFATASSDWTVRLWNVSDGTTLRVLSGHTNQVVSIAFSPDGKTVASASDDKTIRVWRVSDGSLIHVLSGHHNEVVSVAFSPDGKLLASGSRDNTARLWNTADGSLVRELTGHTGWVWSVAFSPDGKLLATGSTDNTIRLWRVSDGGLAYELKGHTDFVLTVAFSPNGELLASGGKDNAIFLWNVKDGTLLREIHNAHASFIASVAFSPDGKLLASAGADSMIRLWGTS